MGSLRRQLRAAAEVCATGVFTKLHGLLPPKILKKVTLTNLYNLQAETRGYFSLFFRLNPFIPIPTTALQRSFASGAHSRANSLPPSLMITASASCLLPSPPSHECRPRNPELRRGIGLSKADVIGSNLGAKSKDFRIVNRCI